MIPIFKKFKGLSIYFFIVLKLIVQYLFYTRKNLKQKIFVVLFYISKRVLCQNFLLAQPSSLNIFLSFLYSILVLIDFILASAEHPFKNDLISCAI